ncbi:MAG: amidohydrolase family protein [Acidobacteriaceae bacterium]|nr:amidohydrolase family protein [Acidobacteriaceae bacterium]
MKPYIAQIRSNLRLMGRDRSVLFFSYLFPLVFFFPFAQMMGGRQSPAAMAQVISMVVIIGVLGNGFFGAGMRAVQDRETNVLRRFKVAPVGPAPIIVASMASGLVSYFPLIVLLFALARIIYHMPVPANLLSILLFVCIAVVAFRSMGMIVAAVVNSAQEAAILTQTLYIPMLFLSGATFPVSVMPIWVQTVAQFLPATYLYQGMQSIMIGGQTLAANLLPIVSLLITMCVALTVGVKLFRWEKEEKISGRAKLWIIAVLAPFLLMGVYQARTRENIQRSKILARKEQRNRTLLFNNVRILVGAGPVIANGAVLVKDGKIAEVFDNPPSDTNSLQAEVIDQSGKTLMPGLTDMHVHIGAFGGVYQDARKYADPNADKRKLAAYLYSGVTAVRSTGDWLNNSLKLKRLIESGEYLGAEFFACGPLFTAPGGHPMELLSFLPASMRKEGEEQFVRLPKDAAQGRAQVDDLKKTGVDGVKAVLEAGNSVVGSFPRLDTGVYDAVISEAAKDNLPSATHTGQASDVKDAADAGTNSVEHGSGIDLIPLATFAEMKAKGIAYDPTASVFEAMLDVHAANPEPLNRSLVQQTAPKELLADTRAMLEKRRPDSKAPILQRWVALSNQNLLNAYRAGVMLIVGSDAGNMLVVHGPTVQHEMELWVKAGIPPAVAIRAATYNAAKVLRAEDRIGSIQRGRDATFILLDGDPLEDISNAERISLVVFRGERIWRSELFDQDKE